MFVALYGYACYLQDLISGFPRGLNFVQLLSALGGGFRLPLKESRVSRSALVDAAFSYHEQLKVFGAILDPGCVPHNP